MSTFDAATRERFPALTGDVVTERHARICRERGHATHTVDGVDSGICPRCGDVKRAALIDARDTITLSHTPEPTMPVAYVRTLLDTFTPDQLRDWYRNAFATSVVETYDDVRRNAARALSAIVARYTRDVHGVDFTR